MLNIRTIYQSMKQKWSPHSSVLSRKKIFDKALNYVQVIDILKKHNFKKNEASLTVFTHERGGAKNLCFIIF